MAGGGQCDRLGSRQQTVATHRTKENNRGNADRGGGEHETAGGLGGEEYGDGLTDQQPECQTSIGELDQRPQQRYAMEVPAHSRMFPERIGHGEEVLGEPGHEGSTGRNGKKESAGHYGRTECGLQEVKEHRLGGHSQDGANRPRILNKSIAFSCGQRIAQLQILINALFPGHFILIPQSHVSP